MRLVLVLSLVFLAGAGLAVPRQDEDQPQERHRADGKTCDNSIDRAEPDRCKCEHAQKCDPNDPADKAKHETMSKECQWYCKPDMCKCGNECNS